MDEAYQVDAPARIEQSAEATIWGAILPPHPVYSVRVNIPELSADFYHVGYTSSHSYTEVKQHWAWIILGWETLQGIPGSAGTYPPPPPPPVYRVQSFQTLFVSIND